MNRLLLSALVMLGLASPVVALSRHYKRAGGTPVPAAASAAGYTNHTYAASKFTPSNVDVGLTYSSGYKLYVVNFFGNQLPASSVRFNPDTAVQVDNTGGLSTIGHIAVAPYFVGTAFGCGAYITAELSFNQAVGMGNPAWWTMAAEHLAQMETGTPSEHWPGQATGYDHFTELDILEFNRDRQLIPYAYSYGSTIHDWYGPSSTICAGTTDAYCQVQSDPNLGNIKAPNQTDFNLYHRVAVLWIPATASTRGYAKFYFDDVLMGAGYSWSQYTNQAAPPTTSSAWLFGIIDQQHLGLMLGAGSGAGAINFRSVDVWQGSGACNITN